MQYFLSQKQLNNHKCMFICMSACSSICLQNPSNILFFILTLSQLLSSSACLIIKLRLGLTLKQLNLVLIQLLLILFRKVALYHHCPSFARSVCQSKGLKSTVLLTFFFIIIIFDIFYFENTENEVFQKRPCVFQACLTWLGLNLDEDN